MEQEQEIDFRDLVNLVRRGFLPALLAGVLVAAGAYFLSRMQEPVYEATATLILSQPAAGLGSLGVSLVTAPAIDVNAYRAAASSNRVIVDALDSLEQPADDMQDVTEFTDNLTARIQENRMSSMLYLDFTASSASAASAGANAVARSLLDWDTDRARSNLQSIVATLEAQIASLDAQLDQMEQPGAANDGWQRESITTLRGQQAVQLNSARALLTSAVGSLEIMESALPPVAPVSPRPLRNAALAFVLAVFVTYGILLLRGAMDTRLRDAEELQRMTGVPVMAEFPVQTGLRHLPREAVGYLRTNVLFSTADVDPKVLLVTGSHASQGKSSVALSLAESFARNGYSTLLIDADLRKPVIHSEYSLAKSQPELPDFLADPDSSELQPLRLDFGKEITMDVIPTFRTPADPTELLNRGMKRLLARLAPEYDIVIIDSAPLLPVADTLAIAPHTSGVIFAASMQEADKRGVTAAFALLGRLGINVIGTVMTHVPRTTGMGGRRTHGYGFGYGYGGGYGEQPKAGD